MNSIKLLSIAISLYLIFGIANSQFDQQSKKTNTNELKTQYVEVIRFKLKSEVTIEHFLKTESDISKGIINSQNGFQGRDVFQNKDGSWLIINRWENKASAASWKPIFLNLKSSKVINNLIDLSSSTQEYYTLVKP